MPVSPALPLCLTTCSPARVLSGYRALMRLDGSHPDPRLPLVG